MKEPIGPKAIIAFLLFAFGFCLYGPTLQNPMLFDDSHFVVLNRSIRNLWNWELLFHGGTQETRPLYNLSLALNYYFHGLEPQGYRLVNIGLHSLCAFLVFLLLSKVSSFKGKLSAFFASLLFLVHPLNTESVNLVSARSGILASLLILLSLLFYHLHRLNPNSRSKWLLIASIFSGLLAQFAKEFAIILPVLIGLWELIFVSEGKWKSFRNQIKPLLFFYGPLVIVVPLLFSFFESPHTGVIGFDVMPVPEFLCRQSSVHLSYLKLLVWPKPLTLWYGPSESANCLVDSAFFAILFFSLLATALFTMRRFPFFSFGVFLYFLNLTPTSSFIPRKDLYGERLLYLSIVGALFVAIEIVHLAKLRFPSRAVSKIFLALAAGFIAWFSSLTWARNALWQSELALWTDAAEAAPTHPLVQLNLGISFLNQNQIPKALEHFQRASSLDPRSAAIHYKWGETLFLTGKKEEASLVFDKALSAGHQKTDILNNIGFLYLQEADYPKAQKFFEAALESDPNNATACSNLGLLFYNQSQFQEAHTWFEKSIVKDPLNPRSFFNLGTAFYMLKDFDGAIRAFKKSIELEPKSDSSWESLGKAYLQQKQIHEAHTAYLKSHQLNPTPEREVILKKLEGLSSSP